MGAKIRDAQLRKVPYMLVVGNREERAQSVSVRLRTNEDRGMTELSSFAEHLRGVVGARDGL
jgi:threonyl-tRNA synthetase